MGLGFKGASEAKLGDKIDYRVYGAGYMWEHNGTAPLLIEDGEGFTVRLFR
jgi:hypothetical protein